MPVGSQEFRHALTHWSTGVAVGLTAPPGTNDGSGVGVCDQTFSGTGLPRWQV